MLKVFKVSSWIYFIFSLLNILTYTIVIGSVDKVAMGIIVLPLSYYIYQKLVAGSFILQSYDLLLGFTLLVLYYNYSVGWMLSLNIGKIQLILASIYVPFFLFLLYSLIVSVRQKIRGTETP